MSFNTDSAGAVSFSFNTLHLSALARLSRAAPLFWPPLAASPNEKFRRPTFLAARAFSVRVSVFVPLAFRALFVIAAPCARPRWWDHRSNCS